MGLEPDGGFPSSSTEEDLHLEAGRSLKEATGMLPYWLMCSLMLCYAVAFGAMTQHAIALLRSQGIGEPGSVWSLTLGISVLGRLLFGALADRFSKRGLLAITWGLHFMGLISALHIPDASAFVWIFALAYGMGQGGFGTVFPLMLGDLFGTEHFSKLYGISLLFQAIGFSIGTPMFGKVFDSTGSYGLAMHFIVAMSFLCILVSAAVRQPRAKRGLLTTPAE